MTRPTSIAFALVTVMLGLMSACNRQTDPPESTHLKLTLTPTPVQVGDATITATLTDEADKPMTGAAVKVEGNMNHAGMQPSFADLTEANPGEYTGTLTFTMGGDWYVLATATLADGQTVTHKVDVKGVKAK